MINSNNTNASKEKELFNLMLKILDKELEAHQYEDFSEECINYRVAVTNAIAAFATIDELELFCVIKDVNRVRDDSLPSQDEPTLNLGSQLGEEGSKIKYRDLLVLDATVGTCIDELEFFHRILAINRVENVEDLKNVYRADTHKDDISEQL